ncbi:MAG: thioredoxin [Candidatus Parvarchaeota archaeon]|nr:thioredoxin [Candidatus Jingweiarchaeum tengchongense]MCW1300478.1 thioredoxin [Candidatus Jingweiarchaeum tengchongense]MCW1304707.1 thioredoxin [Candidatus Jingweiarchaeum tengchongense]MCW1306212.1 thioredoxin [Candidatus Jingweiarchaeum tengchongense]MCW1309556.1 thioredoxin [Candidatus Jingweiarchaeum tengchongense]
MSIVLKDFFAEWCGPCQVQKPIIEKIAKDFEGKITVEKINVDENVEEARKYKISAVPTIVIEKDGEVVEKFIGVVDERTLKKAINSALSQINP